MILSSSLKAAFAALLPTLQTYHLMIIETNVAYSSLQSPVFSCRQIHGFLEVAFFEESASERESIKYVFTKACLRLE
jgi:hypothetical protein